MFAATKRQRTDEAPLPDDSGEEEPMQEGKSLRLFIFDSRKGLTQSDVDLLKPIYLKLCAHSDALMAEEPAGNQQQKRSVQQLMLPYYGEFSGTGL
jgi:hypothetical protein